MNSDKTFITNDEGADLLSRFNILIKDSRFFDILVGYFFASGFYSIYSSLENTEKIRILIGIKTDEEIYHLIKTSKQTQTVFDFSHSEIKEKVSSTLVIEMEKSEDNLSIERGVLKMIEWLRTGKMEIKAYPSQNIHAKLYIMTFTEQDRDKGRVITGSSNFTRSGLIDNLEFNVELKNRSDYDFAINKFNELWTSAVDVSEKYVNTINSKTWLNELITPYELYLKFLYEYFKDELNQIGIIDSIYLPVDFLKLEYQGQAVLNAKRILDEFGGVFISDVVGLGKTYISALLAQKLDGRHLIIAPPILLNEDNPGSWVNVFRDFNVPGTFKSIGKLDEILEENLDQYKNVFIDEAHRFRTETNQTYEKAAQICRGKRVILVTATPYNNYPKDILSQVKLFQKSKKSTIPNLPNLERFFNTLQERLDGLDRQKDHDEYFRIVKENSREIREKVLKYLMVRRTRSEIVKYFSVDFGLQNFKFPEVEDPAPIFYQLNKEEDFAFNRTIELIVKEFKYSRYTPFLPGYYVGEITQPEELSQRNMQKFMRILLVKRLESSFYAFKNSIERFIKSYEQFLREFKNGNVYVSKKFANRIFELIENNEIEIIEEMIEEGDVKRYSSNDFSKDFKLDLESDLKVLYKVKTLWSEIKRDPKILSLLNMLKTNEILKENKLIIFTESKETAEYLYENLKNDTNNKVILFTGVSENYIREKIISNFDGKAKHKKNDYRILISTEVLSEGVNLHQANVVINYDIPWNPTRLMQRAGRINRVDTIYEKIYIFNFFPTQQSNEQIKLKESAEAKIHAFISALGNDARLLTDGETIESHELFNSLMSKSTITGEDENEKSELKYLQIIKGIRSNNILLFEKIKRLPKKARTARKYFSLEGSLLSRKNTLLTYFRKGNIEKFYLSKNESESLELDFLTAAELFETDMAALRVDIPGNYYDLLLINKKEFENTSSEEKAEISFKGGKDSSVSILRFLKAILNYPGFTEDQEEYLKQVVRALNEGGLPRQTTKELLKQLNNLKSSNPFEILASLQNMIPEPLLKEHYSETLIKGYEQSEVILSEYFVSA